MDPPPFKDYQNEFNSLGYSPILGNRPTNQNSQIPKFNFDRPRSDKISANSVAKTLTPPRKRLFSESKLSPTESEQNTKMSKTNEEKTDFSGTDIINCIKAEISSVRSDIKTEVSSVRADMADSGKRISDKLESKFVQLTDPNY